VAKAQGLTTRLDSGPNRPIEGSSGGLRLDDLNHPPGSGPSSSRNDLLGMPRVHKDPYGKPCVVVSAYSKKEVNFEEIFKKSQAVQNSADDTSTAQDNRRKDVYTHLIKAQNHCMQNIKLSVCYYGSQSCVPVSVPAYGRQEAVLGIYPGLSDFRYQYTEQF